MKKNILNVAWDSKKHNICISAVKQYNKLIWFNHNIVDAVKSKSSDVYNFEIGSELVIIGHFVFKFFGISSHATKIYLKLRIVDYNFIGMMCTLYMYIRVT